MNNAIVSKPKVVATIEARMTSSRLPGKVLMTSCGRPILQLMLERVRRSTMIDDVIVATTTNYQDDPIIDLCDELGFSYFRGSEDDVLERVMLAAKEYNADIIVELTGDCPFIDWRQVDELVSIYLNGDYDFVANNIIKSFPVGFDIRIFRTDMLEELNRTSDNPLDHEHVSIHFPNNPDKFKCFNMEAKGEERRPELEVTLDEMGDYKLINAVFEGLYPVDDDFRCVDVIRYIDAHPEINGFIDGIKRTVFDY